MCQKIANTDGTDLQAAQLADDRYDTEIEKLFHKKGRDKYRPPLAGDTAQVKAMRQVSNDIRLLLRRQGIDIPLLEGPEGPAERIRARRRAFGRARIAEMRGTDM